MYYASQYTSKNMISVNPQFNRSKKIIEYDKVRDQLADKQAQINEMVQRDKRTNIGSVPLEKQETYNQLIAERNVLLKEYEEQRKGFLYERNNRFDDGVNLSKQAKRTIQEKVNLLFRKARAGKDKGYKLLWYTFTVPDLRYEDYNPSLHDKIVLGCFSKLLRLLKQEKGLENYIWVAERQTGKRKKGMHMGTATNKLHFHCIFLQDENTFLDIQGVNTAWLWYLQDAGFKIFSENRLEYYKPEIARYHGLSAYYACKEHSLNYFTSEPYWYGSNPQKLPKEKRPMIYKYGLLYAPVDCEEIKSAAKLGRYMAKYVTKGMKDKDSQDDDNDADTKIYCTCW
jgi:hypothetical protein